MLALALSPADLVLPLLGIAILALLALVWLLSR